MSLVAAFGIELPRLGRVAMGRYGRIEHWSAVIFGFVD